MRLNALPILRIATVLSFGLLIVGFLLVNPSVKAERILARPVWTVGVAEKNPPFAFMNEKGEADGFNVEVTNEICRRMGVKCIVRSIPYADLLNELRAGKIDMVVSHMPRLSNEHNVVYTDPYVRSGTILVAKKDRGTMTDIEPNAFAGQTIIAARNARQATVVRDKFVPAGAKLLETDYLEDFFAALRDGRADVGFVDALSAVTYLRTEAGRGFVPIGFYGKGDERAYEQRRVVLSAEHEDSLHELNRTIAEMKLDGALENLSLRYFGFVSY